MYDRLLQFRMRMSTDDHIQIRHFFCKNFILWLWLILWSSTMGKTDDNIRIFVFLNFSYGLFYCFHRIRKLQFAGRCTCQCIFSEYAKQCHPDIALLHHHIIFHTVFRKCITDLLLSFWESLLFHGIPVDITDKKLRHGISAFRRGFKHLSKPLWTIIKFMVAKCCRLTAQCP